MAINLRKINEVSPWYAGQVCDNINEILFGHLIKPWELWEGNDGRSLFSSSSCKHVRSLVHVFK